jgi:hypothetical protein
METAGFVDTGFAAGFADGTGAAATGAGSSAGTVIRFAK